jgi:hypothetical protein
LPLHPIIVGGEDSHLTGQSDCQGHLLSYTLFREVLNKNINKFGGFFRWGVGLPIPPKKCTTKKASQTHLNALKHNSNQLKYLPPPLIHPCTLQDILLRFNTYNIFFVGQAFMENST